MPQTEEISRWCRNCIKFKDYGKNGTCAGMKPLHTYSDDGPEIFGEKPSCLEHSQAFKTLVTLGMLGSSSGGKK